MAGAHQIFHFGPFAFDERRGEIRRDGECVAIHATPLRLLAYLIVHRDRTVAKEELLQRVWPDAFVGENALTSAMCELRRALKVDATSQGLIRTERGRGYRLIAEVETRAGSSSHAALTKVAVLPFADMSPDRDQEHLADGLTEELIHALSSGRRPTKQVVFGRPRAPYRASRGSKLGRSRSGIRPTEIRHNVESLSSASRS